MHGLKTIMTLAIVYLKINIPKVYGRNKGGKIQTTKYTEVMVLNKQWKYITMINFVHLAHYVIHILINKIIR